VTASWECAGNTVILSALTLLVGRHEKVLPQQFPEFYFEVSANQEYLHKNRPVKQKLRDVNIVMLY